MPKPVLSFLSLTSILLLITGCGQNVNNNRTIQMFEENLQESSQLIDLSTESILKTLEDETTLPYTMNEAIYWFPIATHVKLLSDSVYHFIENLKNLKEFDSQKTKELFEHLKKYRLDVLNTDTSIVVEFENRLPFISDVDEDFYTRYFKNSTPTTTSGMLAKFQNDIGIIKNKISAFCLRKVGYNEGYWMFSSYTAIVSQNTKTLKPGDELEIKAGMGAISRAAQPRINISGKLIEVGEEGYAIYRTKASKTPGKYTTPVVISYFNQTTGKEESRKVNIEYIVIKPCDEQ